MTEEDEAFNEIERQAKQRKESVRAAINKEKPMSDEEKIRYRDAFPKDYDIPTYFTSKHAASMTLRDYFAAKAITSVMATPFFQHTSSVRGSCEYADELADECYAIADAMLKAREA